MSVRLACSLRCLALTLLLAGVLCFWPRARGLAQGIGGPTPAIPTGEGRVHVFSRTERIGFVLMSVAGVFFVLAWHYSGKGHRSEW